MRSACTWVILSLFTSHVLQGQSEYPRSAQACYDLGESHIDNHAWQAAREAFDACLQRDAYFANAYYSRGLAREHLQDPEGALTDYNIYLEWRPEHKEALFNRAQLRFRLGQFELARKDFQKLLILPEGETTTVFFRQHVFSGDVSQVFTTQGAGKSYLYNYLGLTESELKDFPSAIVHFDSALRLMPDDADLFVNRGIAYEKMGHREAAQADYQHALKLNPNHALAKHNLSLLGAGKQRSRESMRLLDEAIDDNPELPYAYAERGHTRLEAGDFEGALEDLNQAIRIDSTQADYFLNRGLVHEKLNQVPSAFKDYTKAISINEHFEKAWLNRANLFARVGRLRDAIDDYSVAITYKSNYGAAYYNRALAYRKMGQFRLACADLEKAINFDITVSAKLKKQVCER